MSKYRVKVGHHFVNGKLYGVGDTVDVDNNNFAEGDRAAFFEKVGEESSKAGDTTKRGKKAKAEIAEPGSEDTGPAGEGDAGVAAADKE